MVCGEMMVLFVCCFVVLECPFSHSTSLSFLRTTGNGIPLEVSVVGCAVDSFFWFGWLKKISK